MTTSSYSPSSFWNELNQNLETLRKKSVGCDELHLNLYFSNAISVMEKYLYDLFVFEISSKDTIFKKMCSAEKFKSQKYGLFVVSYGFE